MNEVDVAERAAAESQCSLGQDLACRTECRIAELSAQFGFRQPVQIAVLAIQVGHVTADGERIRSPQREVRQVRCDLPIDDRGVRRQISLEPVRQTEEVELPDAAAQQRVSGIRVVIRHPLGDDLQRADALVVLP